ncbi:hypothetical protein DSECCO2_498230 [anaerobic digester metagenome]
MRGPSLSGIGVFGKYFLEVQKEKCCGCKTCQYVGDRLSYEYSLHAKQTAQQENQGNQENDFSQQGQEKGNFSTCAVESNSKTKNLQESCIFLHDPFFSHIVG